MEVTFVLNGQARTLSRAQVEAAARRVAPEPVRLHAVEVLGRMYPAKQIFAEATGLDRLDFTTLQARTQLIRLGFNVVRAGESK
jgi:5-methylcytosine-specific restriction protein B